MSRRSFFKKGKEDQEWSIDHEAKRTRRTKERLRTLDEETTTTRRDMIPEL